MRTIEFAGLLATILWTTCCGTIVWLQSPRVEWIMPSLCIRNSATFSYSLFNALSRFFSYFIVKFNAINKQYPPNSQQCHLFDSS